MSQNNSYFPFNIKKSKLRTKTNHFTNKFIKVCEKNI